MSSDLPSGWWRAKLGEIGEWTSGGTPSRTEPSYYGPGVPWVKTGDLADGPVLDIPESITDLGLENSSAKRLPSGTLLVAMYGATIGRLGLLGCEAATNQACAALLPNGATADFIPYAFQFLLGQREELRRIGQGGAQPNISQAILKDFEIPLPPLNEQRRIVAKLEALQARSRHAREALDAVPPLLEKLRQSILAAAFSGDLTKDWRAKQKDIEPATELLKRIRTERRQKWEATELTKLKAKGKFPTDESWKAKYSEAEELESSALPSLPEGWCWTTASEVCERVVDCHNKTAPYSALGVPLIRTTNVRNGKIDLAETKFVDEGTYERWSRRCPPESGDVIFTREAPMGEAGMVPEYTRLCMGQRMMLLRADDRLIRRKFLLFAVQAPHVSEYAERLSVGTGVQHLRVRDVESLPVPLAPAAEQEAIEQALEEAWARHSVAARTVLDAAVSFASLEHATLAKAFRGELVPQDPNDEPAEAMLARARSTNGSAAANGTPSKRGRPRAARRAQSSND